MATPKTIIDINFYASRCDLDRLLEHGITQYNKAREHDLVTLKIDWVEVVTHQAKNENEIKERIVHYFEAINSNGRESKYGPSDHLIDTIIAAIVKGDRAVNPNNINTIMDSLKQHSNASKAMKDVLIFCQTDLNFDETIAKAAVRYNARYGNAHSIAFSFNPFVLCAGQWSLLSDGYLSCRDWGRLAQTCAYLQNEYVNRMLSKLSIGGKEAHEQGYKSYLKLIKIFPEPANRIATQIPINEKGILYIQEKLGINCGPNMLIAIRNGQLTLENVQERLQVKRPSLRNQFLYLHDEQFLVLKKYVVDKFFLIGELEKISQERVIRMLTNLRDPQVQFYIDQIALKRDQPIQPLNANAFVVAILAPEFQQHFDTGMMCPSQLLTLTAKCIPILFNKHVKTFIKQKLITIDQILALSHLDFQQLAQLMDLNSETFNITQFFNLSAAGQNLLCDSVMYLYISSQQIVLSEFMALNEVNQQRLHAHWYTLTRLMDSSNRSFPQEKYTLKKLIEIIMDDVNHKALSDPIIKQLILDNILPHETLFELSNSSKNYLCKSDSLKTFFSSTDCMKISEFFKLPSLSQRFIENNWDVIFNQSFGNQLTMYQIRKLTPEDLNVFNRNDVSKYIDDINRKYPDEKCTIS
jgi:hypothetical protein